MGWFCKSVGLLHQSNLHCLSKILSNQTYSASDQYNYFQYLDWIQATNPLQFCRWAVFKQNHKIQHSHMKCASLSLHINSSICFCHVVCQDKFWLPLTDIDGNSAQTICEKKFTFSSMLYSTDTQSTQKKVHAINEVVNRELHEIFPNLVLSSTVAGFAKEDRQVVTLIKWGRPAATIGKDLYNVDCTWTKVASHRSWRNCCAWRTCRRPVPKLPFCKQIYCENLQQIL